MHTASILFAELTLSYQYTQTPAERLSVRSSSDAVDVIRPYFADCIELKEHSYAMLLNKANHVIGVYRLSEGSIDATLIDVRLLFCVALKALATSLILFHNHPSGSLKPSTQDIALTKKVKDGGKLLEVPLLDHIILTKEGYYSLADSGDMI